MEFVQRWEDVLFLHWCIGAEALRAHVPPALEIDTFDGSAWVSAVIFRLRSRLRGMPHFPIVSGLSEVNLRTYVRGAGSTGIWLLSVRADNRIAARVARWLTPIPYAYAPMHYGPAADGFAYRDSQSALTFRPTGTEIAARKGSLDEWLLERYRLFAGVPPTQLQQAVVAHESWIVRAVEVADWVGDFGIGTGLELRRRPDAAHFSTGVEATFGRFARVSIRNDESETRRNQ